MDSRPVMAIVMIPTLNLDDADGDGFDTCSNDCDDNVDTVHPNAIEVLDGIDNNCNGWTDILTAEELLFGDIVINEIMMNPDEVPDADGEWVELYNNTTMLILMNGVTFANSSDFITVDVDDLLPSSDFYVISNNGDTNSNGDFNADFFSWTFSLNNSADSVSVYTELETLDTVTYDNNWPLKKGESMSLDPGSLDATSNDNDNNWCKGDSDFGDGDKGTPGVENDQC